MISLWTPPPPPPPTPWGPILVANRGEIAVRIITAAHTLGLPAIAVYVAADADSGHVTAADTAVCLGDDAGAYTDVAALVAAGTSAGAVAVHPGYGFVAEDAGAADAFEAAGIAWVGPTPSTIRVFGSKHGARAEAVAAGVPVLPASGLVADAAAAADAADALGYPVLLKATAGGGGMGQSPAASRAGVAAAFASAASAGASLFGDGRLYVEKLVGAARHVEVQVFGDGAGGVVSLGDRDCSVQRRRQKVVEEAPAPALSAATRARMAAAAVALTARGAYRSAGTVEFLVDAASSAFYFLEVNTRIQVEAGVTEAVTGVDLVAGMLRLARGDPASDWFPALASAAVADGADPPTADGPVTTVPTAGAAVEARVYAESPLHGYRPSPGTLTAMVWPPPSPTLRVDTWASTGCTVSGAFDPLLGKLIASGPTRAAALATLADALSATVVRGVASNLELLSAVVANEAFAAGEYTTALLDGVTPKACAVEVLAPGVQSSLQDHPGRVGLWRVGVSPSGALDAHAMVAANGLLGNEPGAVAMEMTVRGPTLKVHTQTTVVCRARG
ncbi:hypothetical protein BU14_0290s0029 [Porphyra umbilicalis]|uniref:ATP-grasp domain-containing protein n=1 Tax=Porphyra umbilicalis TaxID=2786 RepID=A0A1X6P0L8_PORUM|nr:hypothetical protein BU14_0290s0029 [Porphyra umbilicalis]|eukprot:OSX74421.1 hypothetical protein BU14_0290s0029 [Porphyra umbilicalis]